MNNRLTTDVKDKVTKFAVAKFVEGLTKKEVTEAVNEEFNTEIKYTSPIISRARQLSVDNYKVPEREHFFKDSIKQYEEITDEIASIRDREKALKLQLSALRDRNELLGLSKAAVNIEINFDSKNYKDEDYLKDRNVVIDVTPEKTEEDV